MSPIHTDILILGAGPSGATASIFLSKAGVPHILLDAATFPRDKVCGDGLDLKVMRVLQHMDPEICKKELFGNPAFLPCWGIRLIAPNGRITDLPYKPKEDEPPFPLFWTSKRLHFDDFLVQKVAEGNADFRQGCVVDRLEKTAEGWIIHAKQFGKPIEFQCKLLLAADGDHSIVLRHLKERNIDRAHYAGTLRQYWRGVAGVHADNLIEVYFPPNQPLSYFYIFPLPNGEANVGFGMVSETVAKHKLNLRETFQKLIREDTVLAPRFKNAQPLEKPVGWGIPLASRRRKSYGEGYLLLGDAASLVTPSSGEGIGTGMMSGYIAAQYAARAVAEQRFDGDFLRPYHVEVYRRLEGEIKMYNLMRAHVPERVYEWALNRIIGNVFLKPLYQKNVGDWLNTAFQKPIVLK